MSNVETSIEVNCETGEVIERPLTEEQLAELNQLRLEAEATRAQEAAAAQAKSELKASAKAKLIAGQPLTAEEADVLVI